MKSSEESTVVDDTKIDVVLLFRQKQNQNQELWMRKE
jgi:hypothetical protein